MLLLIQTWQNNSERTINELERYGIFLKHMTMNQVLQMIRAHHDHRNKIESLLEALREQALTFQQQVRDTRGNIHPDMKKQAIQFAEIEQDKIRQILNSLA